jgi:hypothetical protein
MTESGAPPNDRRPPYAGRPAVWIETLSHVKESLPLDLK